MKVRGTLGRAALIGLFGVFGVVAAFATISPSPDADQPPPSALNTEPIAIHVDDARLPPPASYVREERFLRGDSLAGVLARLGIEAATDQRLLRARVLSGVR